MTVDRFAEIKRTADEGLGCLLSEQDIRWLVAELDRLTEHRDARRARVAVVALKQARTPAFREAIPEHSAAIIPVLLDDPISHLIGQLADAGSAPVLAVAAGDTCRLIRLTEVTISAEGGEV